MQEPGNQVTAGEVVCRQEIGHKNLILELAKDSFANSHTEADPSLIPEQKSTCRIAETENTSLMSFSGSGM